MLERRFRCNIHCKNAFMFKIQSYGAKTEELKKVHLLCDFCDLSRSEFALLDSDAVRI